MTKKLNKYYITTPDNKTFPFSHSPTRKESIATVGCRTRLDWAFLKKAGFNLVKIGRTDEKQQEEAAPPQN